MTVTGIEAAVLLVARLLFGGVIAVTSLAHFLQTDGIVGYARDKGLPAPKLAVLGSGAVLVGGGLSIALGAFAVVGAVTTAAFLLVSAVLMHDFWAVPEDQQQDELTQFLKNAVMAGGALAVAVLALEPRAFSLGLTLL